MEDKPHKFYIQVRRNSGKLDMTRLAGGNAVGPLQTRCFAKCPNVFIGWKTKTLSGVISQVTAANVAATICIA